MFKTILKIAVLSATAITLLSACGAATRALNSAADDALNAALAKAEKRYEKRYTEAISSLTDDNGDPLKVYIDDDGTPFHVTINENGDPIKVTIDDKINSIKAKTDDTGNPIQVTIDDKGNPTPVTIADKSDPILTVATGPTTAEICSNTLTADLWVSPCDNDEASIQRFNKYCLNNLFSWGCAWDDSYDDARHESCLNNPFPKWCVEDGRYDDVRHEICLNNPFLAGCAEDDRYDDARHEYCLNNPFYFFHFTECGTVGELELYSARIKFCNNPANAGHDACVAPSEKPQVNSEGYYYNHFLQGTADGLDTGSLRASISDESAPVVHILKLSDSDDGVAFFAGIAPVLEEDQHALDWKYYYAGILPDPNLGAPITRTSGTAVWQGTFSVIGFNAIRLDRDFDLEINFAKNQLSASINVLEYTFDSYVDYRLSGVFYDGKIEGGIHATYVYNDGSSWVEEARVQGLIGQDGAIGAFVGGSLDLYNEGYYSGGFVARPPSK